MFNDRIDAGRRLGEALKHLREEDPVILGLPRGGVPVANEVARMLGAPLDVLVVRKLGLPQHEELAFGAVGEGGVRVLNDYVVERGGLGEEEIASVERIEQAEVEQRAQRFREGRDRVSPAGRTAVLVDDGVATGSTAEAACRVAQEQGATRVVLAVPTAAQEAVDRLRTRVDEVVCLSTPDMFGSVGEWYRDFAQTSDEEVVRLLSRAPDSAEGTTGEGPGAERAGPKGLGTGEGPEVEVEVEAGGVRLSGELLLPEDADAVVMFAHGSGSSRHSPRNRSVAAGLQEAGLGTLLFDLLTPEEETDRENVFDTEALGLRLAEATRWLRDRVSVRIGYFGASTGAAAALRAAADLGAGPEGGPRVDAVVSRGGRPDLAGERLPEVQAPTLLVVGGDDPTVLGLNREAQARLRCESSLEVVPGATHLFEEPGALDQVAGLARDWFLRHLTRQGAGQAA